MTRKEQDDIYNQWLEKHRPLLFKVVKVYTDNSFDENDLFQEIVIQMWRSVLSFKGQSRESTWIYKVALNTAMKWSARTKRQPTDELTERSNIISQVNAPNEHLEWLYSEIYKLQTVDRSLTLLMLDGFSYKEMSEIIGISTNLVGVKINRIKKHLREKSKNVTL